MTETLWLLLIMVVFVVCFALTTRDIIQSMREDDNGG